MKKEKSLGFQERNEDAISRCELTLLTHDTWVICPLPTIITVNLLDETDNLHVIHYNTILIFIDSHHQENCLMPLGHTRPT